MHNAKRPIAILLVLCFLLSVLPVSALAVSISTKPADGNTTGQPFAAGTGGSQNFRIPGIVTLDDGTLIAACDARWNHAGDGAGLDTIVSVSKDNGANWTYTFANYLGDNGNTYNNLSTCFIDPGIGTDGTTAYLIADLWPAGIALNTSMYSPVAGENGFDDNGNLLLRDASQDTVSIGWSGYNTMAAVVSRYTYYLDLENLTLHKNDGTPVEGYTVDAYFNIKSDNGSVNTNLFFSDSPFQPYPTDYLYMTTSTDGLNWSVPELLNLKEESEQTLLVGPGNGTYDEVNDRMIFTAYEHSSGYERACLIWMDSEGNWHRSEDATASNWSSEATSVVLDDGTVRCFYRDGFTSLRYTDYVFNESVNNYVVSAREVSTAATVDYGCQLTSILYSEQIDGKDVILVAGPTSYRRINGYIYAFLVDEDNSMELAYAYNVTPDAYAYSCLTELGDGRIGLLYENAGSSIYFDVYDFEDIANRENDPRLTFRQMELLTGDSKTYTDNSGYYGNADVSELDTTVAELVMTGEEINTDAAQLGSNASYNGDVIALEDCLYTFTQGEDGRWSAAAADGTVYLYPGNTTASGYPNREAEYANLSIFEGYEDGTFCIMSNDCDNTNQSTSYLYFDRSGLRWDRVSSPAGNATWLVNTSMRLYKPVEGAGSAEIPGYERVTELSELTDGEYLVVGPGDDGNMYALYPNTSTANRYCQIAKLLGRTTVGWTELTFTGVGAGYTEVQVGSTVYQITVAELSEVLVDVPVGTSVTVTEANGNYANTDTSALDTSVATVVMTGTNGTTANGLSASPVSELADGTYVIVNTRANKMVTNAPASAAAAAGAGSGLNLDGSIRNDVAPIAVWNITRTDGGYTVQDLNGQYMTIGSTTAGVTSTPTTLSLNWRGSTWTIAKDGAYLNHFGGGSSTCAAGWQDATAAGDAGSQFDIYAYSEQSYGPSTELTFTGVYPGTTELLVGRTKFIVNVTGNVIDVDLTVGEKQSYVVAGDQTEADTSKLDTSVATVEMALAAVGHVSNGTGYNAEAVQLADCLYTFKSIDGGYYEVSATTADGTVVYLNHFSSGNNNPNITTPGKIDVQTSAHTNMFKLVAMNIDGSAAANRGLHFHSEASMPYWNRCGNDTTTKCHEYLYRPAQVGEASSEEIQGYVLVTDISEIVDGGQYLIVHDDDWGNLYILHPSTDANDKWSHVAKLGTATEVTFTGVGNGETALTVPGTVFEITVTGEDVHEHVYEAVVTEPTCTEGGYTTYTCECGESYVADETEALGHEYEAVVTEPTCTEGGYTTYTCERCGDSYVDDETDALGHDWNEDGVCNNCGEQLPTGSEKIENITGDGSSFDTSEPAFDKSVGNAFDGDYSTFWATVPEGTLADAYLIADLGGEYTINKVEYTQRYDAAAIYNCTGNLLDYIIEVSTDGETWIQVAAGDTVDGTTVIEFAPVQAAYVRLTATKSYHWQASLVNTVMCVAELAVYGISGGETPHEHPPAEAVRENEKAATCTEDGSYESVVYCAECGKELSRETVTVPAAGHTEEIIPAVEPTCTETGLTEGKKCSVCGETLVAQDVVPALGHSFGDWTVTTEPTCTETGVETRTCECGETETRTVEALGHSYEAVVTDPTCTEGGYTTYTCSVCGDSYVDDETAALGHSFGEWVVTTEPTCTAAGVETRTCACGETETREIAALGHTEEVIPAAQPTCTETGLTEGKKCSVCNEILVAQEVVPALGHDFVNGECSRCDAKRENPFVDVPDDSFYIEPVLWAVEEGITTGVTETIFDPNGESMRAHVVTFLWRAAGEPEPTIGYNPFVDVNEGDYFYKAVLWAYEKGITIGTTANTFSPTLPCNRAQVVTFLYRAAGQPEITNRTTKFTDLVYGEFYFDAVLWAVENGITEGVTETEFAPTSICNRAQIVTFLYRMYN